MLFMLALAGAFGLAQGEALANDTAVEVGAGGLEYVQNDQIEMAREDLFISRDQVRVDYVFHNSADRDISLLVAFPMPDISMGPEGSDETGIPYAMEDNFLRFSVSVEGQPLQPRLQQRAEVLGVDMTAQLLKRGIPLLQNHPRMYERLLELDRAELEEMERFGLVQLYVHGSEVNAVPLWTLHSAYYWEMTFPAGQDLHVSHTYTPAVGGTTGLDGFFLADGMDIPAEYAERYCVDAGFVRAVRSRTANGSLMFENWISYILMTGRNWLNPIGTFHLTVDKGAPENLVSFCGKGVTKTGPTTFEMTVQDFVPERNLDVLLLEDMGR